MDATAKKAIDDFKARLLAFTSAQCAELKAQTGLHPSAINIDIAEKSSFSSSREFVVIQVGARFDV